MSFELAEGEALAVLGPNGVGKTTLIDSIIGVTTHFSGHLYFKGEDITRLRPEQRAAAGIGWVPQERNIFKSLSVEENLTAVARPGPWTLERAYAMFPRIKERRTNLGGQLSGGEQQRVSIARAICKNPKLLLCDEPTGALDSETGSMILSLLQRMSRQYGQTVIIVSHNAAIAPAADRVIQLRNGKVIQQIINESPVSIEEVSW